MIRCRTPALRVPHDDWAPLGKLLAWTSQSCGRPAASGKRSIGSLAHDVAVARLASLCKAEQVRSRLLETASSLSAEVCDSGLSFSQLPLIFALSLSFGLSWPQKRSCVVCLISSSRASPTLPMADDTLTAINTATAAVRLVGAVLNTAGPHVKNALNRSNAQDADVTGGSTSAAPGGPGVPIAPERETRAYETVNYVLRTMGSRILAAGLVNEQALAQALTAATSHIEMRLFSVETNRLFQSLASKLNDVTLVNSVFTCIYFFGFLLSEIKSSLPGYKATYIPLGQRIVQQVFKVAIGEDAFQENRDANLEAYKTLTATAGLLRPTDLNCSIFPGTSHNRNAIMEAV